MRKFLSRLLLSSFALLVLALATVWPSRLSSLVQVRPGSIVLHDPNFRATLFATFHSPADKTAFGLVFNAGQNGFPRGLYKTTGFSNDPDAAGTDVVLVTAPETFRPFATGFQSSDIARFAPGGSFGTDLLVPDPFANTIFSVNPSGARSVFSTGVPSPSAVSASSFEAFGNDLYVTSYQNRAVYRVNSNGQAKLFSQLFLGEVFPPEAFDPDIEVGAVDLAFPAADTPSSSSFGFGTLLYVSAFTNPLVIPNRGEIFRIDPAGNAVPFVTNLNGLEGMAFAPPGPFRADLYVSSICGVDLTVRAHGLSVSRKSHVREMIGRILGGSAAFAHESPTCLGDGGVFRINRAGRISLFASGINAGSIAFDREGIFGGGMFVADFREPPLSPGAPIGHIYQITPLGPPPAGRGTSPR